MYIIILSTYYNSVEHIIINLIQSNKREIALLIKLIISWKKTHDEISINMTHLLHINLLNLLIKKKIRKTTII